MTQEPISKIGRTGRSLLRQLTGAVVGGSLALGIYHVYTFGAPLVTAWLTVPQKQYSVTNTENVTVQQDLQEEEIRRMTQRAKSIVNRFGKEVPVPPTVTPIPANWDIEAIANEDENTWGSWDPQQNKETSTHIEEAEQPQPEADIPPEVDVPQEEEKGSNTQTQEQAPADIAYMQEATPVVPQWNPAPVQTMWAQPQEVTQIQSASTLPDSGLGLSVATFLTLCGTLVLQRRRILAFVRG